MRWRCWQWLTTISWQHGKAISSSPPSIPSSMRIPGSTSFLSAWYMIPFNFAEVTSALVFSYFGFAEVTPSQQKKKQFLCFAFDFS